MSPLPLSLSCQVEYDGLTGHIEFNSKGQRTNYTLKILEKHPAGHKEVRGQTGSCGGQTGRFSQLLLLQPLSGSAVGPSIKTGKQVLCVSVLFYDPINVHY